MWKKYKKLNQKQIYELGDLVNQSQSSGKEVRRAQAVLLLDQEEDLALIGRITKYSRRQIFDLRKNYLLQGLKSILDQRTKKARELLTKKQKQAIAEILTSQKPQDFNYSSDFWTTGILGDLIKREYNVQYKSKTSYYLIFKKAKFTYHKPGRIYEKRDEAEVQEWRRKTAPIVKKALCQPKTIVLAEDEMSLSTQTTTQKVWLPQGQYPRIEVASKRESRSIYGFLNLATGQEHAFKTKWQNMYITSDILKKLRKIYSTEKILLLWDQGPWHKGSKAQEFIKQDQNIQTIYFPRSAPEENPQEHVWKNGRSQITHNKFIQNINQTTDEFVRYLNKTKFNYSFLSASAEM